MSVRIGVIGAGFIGARHLSNLATMEGVSIAAVADVDGSRVQEQAARYGAPAYSDWRVMLERERPDAVYLCLPPFAHGEPEEALVDGGTPFFTEKPLGVSADVPEHIADRVAARGLLTSVGYHWRYLDTIERAREMAQAHQPRLAMGYWFDFVPPPPWWIRRELSGGQVIEQGTHIFDLTRYLLGEPQQVYGAACRAGLSRHPDCDIDTATSATLQFQSGAIGVITSTCVVHYPCRIGLWLYAEDLILECREFSLRIETPEGSEDHEPQVDPFFAEDSAFVRALRTGDRSAVRVPYAEALRTHRLTMRVLESAAEGRPLALTPDGLLERDR